MGRPSTRCILCGDSAVAIFSFSHGSDRDASPVQALCLDHAYRSLPVPGGVMELVEDLSIDGLFGNHWWDREKAWEEYLVAHRELDESRGDRAADLGDREAGR